MVPQGTFAEMISFIFLRSVGCSLPNRCLHSDTIFVSAFQTQKEDVDSLPLGDIKGPTSAADFKKTVTEHDLVLTNQSDENHVTTISGLIQGTMNQ